MPPPAAPAASIARLMEGVSIVAPSPVAPNIFTSNVLRPEPCAASALAAGKAAFATAAPAIPAPDSLRKSLRSEFIDLSFCALSTLEPLETGLHPELHNPRLGCSIGGWASVRSRKLRSPDLAEGSTARVVIGCAKIGVVGHVENVSAQLQRHLFEGSVLDCGYIGVEEPGSTQHIFSRVSEGAIRVHSEIGGIEPLADHAGVRPVTEHGVSRFGDID